MAATGVIQIIKEQENLRELDEIQDVNQIQQNTEVDTGSEDSDDASSSSSSDDDDYESRPEGSSSKSLHFLVAICLSLVTFMMLLYFDSRNYQKDTVLTLIMAQFDKAFKLLTNVISEIYEVVEIRIVNIFSLGGFLINYLYQCISNFTQ